MMENVPWLLRYNINNGGSSDMGGAERVAKSVKAGRITPARELVSGGGDDVWFQCRK
jgi:hypothetical protein